MFDKKLIFIFIFLIIAIGAVSTVSASDFNGTDDAINEIEDNIILKDSTDEILTESNDIYVDLNSKSNVEDGSQSNPYKTFKKAYDASDNGDVINIAPGVYKGEDNLKLSIDKSLTIKSTSDGVIFDGEGKNYIFNFYGGYIDGITFQNGFKSDHDEDGNGAAIYIGEYGEYCFISNCTFINNTAISGGAISVNWYRLINGWSCSNIFITDCDFEGNVANGGDNDRAGCGGSIFLGRGSNYEITGCSFSNDDAKSKGSSIYGVDNDCMINECTFNNGRIYLDSENCRIFNSNFSNNERESIYLNGANSRVARCIFENNTQSSIYLNGEYLAVIKCIFKNNSIKKGYGGGAAIKCNGNHYILNNNTFINNKASYGGAVYIQGYNDGYNITVNDSYFDNNFAYGKGGAVYWCNGNDGVLSYSTFTNNAAEIGGAVYWGVDDGTISYCKSYTKNQTKGNDIYLDGSNIVLIEYPLNIDVSDIMMYYGSSEKYLVTLTKSGEPIAYANVNININNENYNIKTNSSGTASYKLNLPVGNYIVTAEYDGVKDSSNVLIKSTITADDCIGEYLNSKVSSTFLNTGGKALSGKQVTFKVNGKDYTAKTDSKGVATANVTLSAGTYTVTAINPINKEEKEFKLTINKAGSLINLESSQNAGVITLTTSLTPASATGDVAFTVGGKNYSAGVKNGVASVSLKDLEAGNYTATAVYDGDNNLNSSASNTVTFDVLDVYPILTVKDITKTYGASNKLLINLVDNKGNAIANVNIEVVLNGVTKSLTTDSKGQASMAVGVAPGTYNAVVSYDDTKATAKVIVKKATPKFTASKKTYKVKTKTKKYTVTLKVNSKALKKVKVTIKVNGKTYSAKTNSKGKATFKITKLTKKGTFKAKINYSGSKYYNKATKTVKLTIKK